jgi:hypothetical protein
MVARPGDRDCCASTISGVTSDQLRARVADDIARVVPSLDAEVVAGRFRQQVLALPNFWLTHVDPVTTFALIQLIQGERPNPSKQLSSDPHLSERLDFIQRGYVVGRIAAGTELIELQYSGLPSTAFAGIRSEREAVALRERNPRAFQTADLIEQAASASYWDGPLGDLDGFGGFLAGLAVGAETMLTEVAFVFVCQGFIAAMAEGRLIQDGRT